MTQYYSNPARENDERALPDVEVFEVGGRELKDDDGNWLEAGWYWWFCFPGCIPDSSAFGPFPSEQLAVMDAQEMGAEIEDAQA